MNCPQFDSIVQCHAFTGIPVIEMRKAKKMGCGAFKGHRVDLFMLLKWQWSSRNKEYESPKDRDLTASAKLKEQRLRVESGELAPKEFVDKALRETMLPVRQRLMAMPSEIAHNANPGDAARAREACEQWLETNLPLMKAGEGKK